MASITRLPAPRQESYEWQYLGACNAADPETFFPPEYERGPRRRHREATAKSFCAQCPVVKECLAGRSSGVVGLSQHKLYGIEKVRLTRAIAAN